MRIRVRAGLDAVDRGLNRETERRVGRALGALSRRVSSVAVRLLDLNGPRGGVDKACEVTVSLTRAGTVHYRAVAGSAAAAINQAVDGTREAVARRLALRREVRRRERARSAGLARDLA